MASDKRNLLGTSLVYAGLVTITTGLLALVLSPFGVELGSPAWDVVLLVIGILALVVGFVVPPGVYSSASPCTLLDQFIPNWQFGERHEIEISAPPERIYAAIKAVRPNEIFLFRTLTWLRRGGRRLPRSILNAGDSEPLIDVALQGGFALLGDLPNKEIVLGMAVIAPPGVICDRDQNSFRMAEPGYALAAINFIIMPQGPHWSTVMTETRVHATSRGPRLRFAGYWRVIYPGSALIRRMWLRAVRRRATSPLAP